MKIYGFILSSESILPDSKMALAVPQSGANITLDGDPTVFTMAKDDGSFEMESDSIKPGSKIRISFIGLQPRIIPASQLEGKSIVLTPKTEIPADIKLHHAVPEAETEPELNFFETARQVIIDNRIPLLFATGFLIIAGSIVIFNKLKK